MDSQSIEGYVYWGKSGFPSRANGNIVLNSAGVELTSPLTQSYQLAWPEIEGYSYSRINGNVFFYHSRSDLPRWLGYGGFSNQTAKVIQALTEHGIARVPSRGPWKGMIWVPVIFIIILAVFIWIYSIVTK